MDISSVIGIFFGLACLLIAFVLEGGSLGSLLSEPSPYIIIFGGTAGAILLSYPLSELAKIPNLLKIVFIEKEYNEIDTINQIAQLSEKARKDGLLSLEQETESNPSELIKKGVSLIVDGIEADVIRDILERETSLNLNIYESGAKIFEAAGGFSPTMGVCGTVLGMISILANMTTPEEIGPKISTAFIATLLGISFANLVFIPIGAKIKYKAEREASINNMIIEGLLSIQAGENPRIIKEKLNLASLEKMSKTGNFKKSIIEEEEE